jgi:hypothetical protein
MGGVGWRFIEVQLCESERGAVAGDEWRSGVTL